MAELDMESRMMEFFSERCASAPLHAVQGHFATSHSHINYYIDLTSMKIRVKEARMIAKEFAAFYRGKNKVVDTIICMDGTETVGSFLAEELELQNNLISNDHQTIDVITPEYNRNNQLMFRDNIAPSVRGKHVVLLMATTTTGLTIRRTKECVQYYGGKVAGINSIFSTVSEIDGEDVDYLFSAEDLPGYQAFGPGECPFCNRGMQIEAMVNGFGYSRYSSF